MQIFPFLKCEYIFLRTLSLPPLSLSLYIYIYIYIYIERDRQTDRQTETERNITNFLHPGFSFIRYLFYF